MAWVKLDDNFFLHPKARAVGAQGQLLYLASLCWAARSETGGVVPTADLPLLAATVGVKPSAARILVDAGMWEVHADGWEIHDYLEYNPSAQEARERRRKRAEAGRKGGLKSRPPGSKPEANASANGEAEMQAESNPVPVPLVTGSHPQTTSSCGEPDKPDDDDEPKLSRQARAVAACDLLGDRSHQARLDAGQVRTPKPHRESCRNSARADHLEQAQQLAHEYPDASPAEIAGEILALTSDAKTGGNSNGFRPGNERETGALYERDETARRAYDATAPPADKATNLTGLAAARAAQVRTDAE